MLALVSTRKRTREERSLMKKRWLVIGPDALAAGLARNFSRHCTRSGTFACFGTILLVVPRYGTICAEDERLSAFTLEVQCRS